MATNDPNDKTGLPPNPANDVYVVSTGIPPDLNDQSEAEAVVALDPPSDQIPALDGGSTALSAADEEDDPRRDRLQASADDDENTPAENQETQDTSASTTVPAADQPATNG